MPIISTSYNTLIKWIIQSECYLLWILLSTRHTLLKWITHEFQPWSELNGCYVHFAFTSQVNFQWISTINWTETGCWDWNSSTQRRCCAYHIHDVVCKHKHQIYSSVKIKMILIFTDKLPPQTPGIKENSETIKKRFQFCRDLPLRPVAATIILQFCKRSHHLQTLSRKAQGRSPSSALLEPHSSRKGTSLVFFFEFPSRTSWCIFV